MLIVYRNKVFNATIFLIAAAAVLGISCSGVPKAAPEALPEPQAVQAEPEPAEPFDPAAVSVEVKQAAFIDVRALIRSLNAVIQAKDYEAWCSALTDEYRTYYSSPTTLAKLSASPVLRRQSIVLRTLKDYFLYVVYPSRQNDRVDDIEFIDKNTIKAIILNQKGERLVLYHLTKSDDTWKISIGR